MPVRHSKGTYLKGIAVSDNEIETQEFIAQKREDGASVKLRRSYKWVQGKRVEVDPKLHRIYWTY